MSEVPLTREELARRYAAGVSNWMRLVGYTAQNTASLLDISPSMLSQIMTGGKVPGLELVARTLSVTGMTPNELFASPDYTSPDDTPMDALRSLSETHALMGEKIRGIYELLKD